jgi:pimeloyl-ACP methyl ester carboxylesterase
MAERTVEAFPPAAPVTIVMGARDESVPIEGVREVWEGWKRSGNLDPKSRFLELAGGDHGLTDFVADLAGEIRRCLADSPAGRRRSG